ncbi:polyprenyl synthetase family protein [Salininema proteolyticum]|uniref:Polyprenyl synthetase family protein n=1 Tax=Salininema proteolyticum TaxID=1607685 RepID=A0ABV8TYJ6_9ACTN
MDQISTDLTDRGADRAAIDRALREAVDTLAPDVAQVASYHFGWTDAEGRPAEARPGKHVRPLLACLTADALGADREAALAAACAVELVHNHSLVHDDVIDRDTHRRSRPTVWAVYGVPAAILVGDAMHALAFEALSRLPGTRVDSASSLLGKTVNQLVRGQMSDMAFETRTDVRLGDCVEMVAGKTAALMACSTSLGAIVAGAEEETENSAYRFGFHLGMCFQHVDDLLGIWGEQEATGKPKYSDLRNRKKSLPVVAAFESESSEAERLRDFFAPAADQTERLYGLPTERRGDEEEADYEAMAELVSRLGGEAVSRSAAEAHLEQALAALDGMGLDTEGAAPLRAMAVLLAERDRL